MNFKKILIETSERRVRKAPSISALSLLKKELSGSQSEALAIDSLLEEVLRKNGDILVENNLISLVRQYNCNDISGDLRRKIRDLKERLNAGKDTPFTRMMLRIILRSKKKQLEKQQGSPPSTPASSDDEDDEMMRLTLRMSFPLGIRKRMRITLRITVLIIICFQYVQFQPALL